MSRVRAVVFRGLACPTVHTVFRALLSQKCAIFMLHRFRHPDRGVEGHDPVLLRNALGHLRRRRVPLVAIEEVVTAVTGDVRVPPGAVGFTIDDGYADQAEVAAPIFAEFDCPVTTFVTTGFLDRETWNWWDQVEHVFERTPRCHLEVALGEARFSYDLPDGASRSRAAADFVGRCKQVPNQDRIHGIAEVAAAGEVDLPEQPPAQYAPMSWSDLRTCERGGMSFGPHTVTHPILARVDDAGARAEIEGSWLRVAGEARNPCPVFCYPNGQPRDFGPREYDILAAVGLIGAVTAGPAYVSTVERSSRDRPQYRIDRFSFPDSLDPFLQIVSGFQRVKELIRGGT
jgi:peptidoglycan/xylan/chitin deacetylase (PgdA/CDA1 family)